MLLFRMMDIYITLLYSGIKRWETSTSWLCTGRLRWRRCGKYTRLEIRGAVIAHYHQYFWITIKYHNTDNHNVLWQWRSSEKRTRSRHLRSLVKFMDSNSDLNAEIETMLRVNKTDVDLIHLKCHQMQLKLFWRRFRISLIQPEILHFIQSQK